MWTCGQDSPPATVPRTSAVVAVMVLRTVSLLLDGISLALSTRRGRGVTCHFGPSGLAASSIGSHRGVPTQGPPVSPHPAAYCGLGSSFGVEDRPCSLPLLDEVQCFGKSSLEQGTEGRLCPVSVCLETCPHLAPARLWLPSFCCSPRICPGLVLFVKPLLALGLMLPQPAALTTCRSDWGESPSATSSPRAQVAPVLGSVPDAGGTRLHDNLKEPLQAVDDGHRGGRKGLSWLGSPKSQP